MPTYLASVRPPFGIGSATVRQRIIGLWRRSMATPLPGVWGIDLGQCALKALRLEIIEGEVKATAFDYIEHPKILSQPDADPDQLIREALTQFLSRNNLKGDVVVISVPGQSGLARFVKLPPVEEKKIADIVRFEAKQQIPFPLEEVVWDFQKINSGQVTDGFAMETEIGLFAMKRDMVNRALTHFKDVNVEIHIIQMAPLALVNYVAYDLLGHTADGPPPEGANPKECIVALDIGTDNSNLIITDGGKIIWQRPIPLGGNHFTRALTKDLKLTFAKAEHLKRNAAKSPDLKKILGSLKPVLNDFVGEVQRSLGYFTNTHRDATIQYMIGLGNAFRLPGLQKYLQEKLSLEVKKLQTFERVKGDEVLGAPQFSENIMTFGVPYGLALQGLKKTKLQTNLLPHEVRLERIVRGKKPYAVAAAAALLLMVGGMTLGSAMAKSTFDRTVNPDLDAAMKKKEDADKRAAGYKSEADSIRAEIQKSNLAVERIQAGIGERFNWQRLLRYVDLALPQPNGAKVTTGSRQFQNVFKDYMDGDSQKAFALYQARRFAKPGAAPINPRERAGEEEYIKKHLVQVNIEGITPLYSDDLKLYFKKIHTDRPTLLGMTPAERRMVADAAAGQEVKDLPVKGWVIEIRGYYYHRDSEDFLQKTLIENLKLPKQPNVNPDLPKDLEEQVLKNIGFFFLYKNERIENPEPGIFTHIKTSYLGSLMTPNAAAGGDGQGGMPIMPMGGDMAAPGGDAAAGGEDPAKKSRSSWKSVGEVAGSILGGVGGGGGMDGMMNQGGGGVAEPIMQPKIMQQQIRGIPGGAAQDKAAAAVERQDRYEFVLLFVWKEPLSAASLFETAAQP
jgi:type IV pilus assembly protein PilM